MKIGCCCRSASPDVSTAVAGIVAFQPHVIVSFASDEFVTLLQTVEIEWPNSVPWKPVWILSPYNFQNADLVAWANSLPAKLSRLVGVNVASTTNSVTSNYNTNFIAAIPRFLPISTIATTPRTSRSTPSSLPRTSRRDLSQAAT